LNERLSNYLLVIPQIATDPGYHLIVGMTSRSDPTQLSAEHFANAAAVMEMQWQSGPGDSIYIDHTVENVGGKCFKKIGADPAIFFVGAPFKRDGQDNPLNRLKHCGDYDRAIKVWDIEWEVTVNMQTGIGEIYLIGEAIVPEFTAPEVSGWGMQLRDWANEEDARGDAEGYAESLYTVSNCTPDREKILGFDPYEIDKSGLSDESGNPISLIPHLEKVLEYATALQEYFPETKMGEWLTKLLAHLKAQRDNPVAAPATV